ncbi:MAG: hypothetical protein WA725_04815, partial [Pseudolabrys sp.]
NSQSNTKSCVQPVNFGDNGPMNAGSIGPARSREKFFLGPGGVGFYASGHDRKVTQKWDFRADALCDPTRTEAGKGRGKIRPLHAWSR